MRHTKFYAILAAVIMATVFPFQTIMAQDEVSVNANANGITITKHGNLKNGKQDTVVRLTSEGIVTTLDSLASDSLYDEEHAGYYEKSRILPMIDIDNMAGKMGAIVIIGIIFGTILLISPLIAIVLIYNSRQKTKLARSEMIAQAIEQDKPIPDGVLNEELSGSGDKAWTSGVRQTAIGIGLIIMFCTLGLDALWGIGALIACMGIGKMVIAKTTRRNDYDK